MKQLTVQRANIRGDFSAHFTKAAQVCSKFPGAYRGVAQFEPGVFGFPKSNPHQLPALAWAISDYRQV